MEKRVKVLVVDDDDRNLRVVEAMLIPEDYEVVLAHSGEEGLEKIDQSPPDIVLLDIMMPGMSGYDVLSTIRQQSNIPVIMLTAKEELTSIVEALGLGANDYVIKPFIKKELLARIKAKLRRAGLESESQNTEKTNG